MDGRKSIELLRILLLSHHAPEQEDHCWRLFGVPICARCTGIYPVMIALLVPQMLSRDGTLALRGRAQPMLDLAWTDPWLVLVFPLPAVAEFLLEHTGRIRGTNSLRIVTGIPLGIAMSRMFTRYLADPFDPFFWAVVAVYGGACGLVAAFVLRKRLQGTN